MPIDAASTADAPASRASARCSGWAAPPDAMTGTLTASTTARDAPPHPLVRIATLLAIPMTALVLSPYHRHEWVRALLFVYVLSLIHI